MSLSDPIADMLTTIRNGQSVRLASVSCPHSKLREGVLNVLKNEGYIKDYNKVNVRTGVNRININLAYFEGNPVIKEIKRVSKPGLRNYSSIKDLPKVSNGIGISIISTSKGVMADHDARAANIGGEILCNIF